MKGYSMERAMKIYNDDTGEHIEVTEDADGLGLLEIRIRDSDGVIGDRMTFEPDQIPFLIKALTEVTKSIRAKE